MKTRTLFLAAMILGLAGISSAADLTSHNQARELALGGSHVTGLNTAVALRVRWIGTPGKGASVQVDGSGNLLFTTDGTTVDPSITATGTTGTITVSNSLANTYGKVAGIINASKYWRCYLRENNP